MGKKRHGIQLAAALLQNAHFRGFFTGELYQGAGKAVCVPGLNCYSCPGAVGACPLGSLQTALSRKPVRLPYYVVGLLVFFGALLGRSICGFLCPVGFLQELVHKIPFVKKIKNWKGDKPLRYLKYAVLALFVVILPLAMTLTPAFCKYICPGGTLSALLLAAADKSIRPLLGALFRWKLAVLLILLLLCLSIWRPFCKYLCPLGALYGFFNRVSLHRLRLDVSRCVHCGKCESACPMCVRPAENPASMECIRCGECVNVCPVDALSLGWGGQTEKSAPCVKRGR